MKITLFIILMTIVPLLSFAQNTNESGPIPNAKVKPLPESSKGSLQKTKATPKNSSTVKEFTQLEQNTIAHRAQLKEKLAKEQQIYMKYLGVNSPNDPLYASKKRDLLNDRPHEYEQFKEELNNLNHIYSKKRLSRAKYNSLSEEQRKEIDNNPEKYDITE